MSTTPSRPREVPLAGWSTIVASALGLIAAFSVVGELNSSALRRQVESLLDDPRFSALDLSIETVLSLVRVGLMATASACVIAIVLAVYVMRRHNASRIALSILGGIVAVLALLSGLPGVFVAIFISYTVSLLWRSDVRKWFAGEFRASRLDARPEQDDQSTPHGPDEQPQPQAGVAQPDKELESTMSGDNPNAPGPSGGEHPGAQSPQGGPPGPYGGGGPYGAPGPQGPYGGQQPPGPYGTPGPYGGPGPYGQPQHGQVPPGQPPQYGYPSPYGAPPPPYGYGPDPQRRPAPVTTALILTWVGSGFSVLLGLLLMLVSGSDEIVETLEEDLGGIGMQQDDLTTLIAVMGGITAAWAVAVLVVSIFAWRRANWARITLTVMGGIYLVLQVVALASGAFQVVLSVLWVGAVIVLLWLPVSRMWYATKSMPPPGSPYPPYPPYPPPQQPPPPGPHQPW